MMRDVPITGPAWALGYCAPGGSPVTLTTCPRCDRKDNDE
jgi:hypothetical protein